MNIVLKNIIDAFVEDGNIMVVLKNEDAGTVYVEDEKLHQTIGYPVEVLPTTHKLYASVVQKFNINV